MAAALDPVAGIVVYPVVSDLRIQRSAIGITVYPPAAVVMHVIGGYQRINVPATIRVNVYALGAVIDFVAVHLHYQHTVIFQTIYPHTVGIHRVVAHHIMRPDRSALVTAHVYPLTLIAVHRVAVYAKIDFGVAVIIAVKTHTAVVGYRVARNGADQLRGCIPHITIDPARIVVRYLVAADVHRYLCCTRTIDVYPVAQRVTDDAIGDVYCYIISRRAHIDTAVGVLQGAVRQRHKLVAGCSYHPDPVPVPLGRHGR